jgi:hypothetical protein
VSDLPVLISDIAALTALAAVVNVGTNTIEQFRRTRAEARKLDKEFEADALQSNDIAKLGKYLYDNIGGTRVSIYVSDRAVRERVGQALSSVLAFLGPEETSITPEEAEEAEEAGQSRQAPELRERYSLEQAEGSESMRQSLEEIRVGEVWNGLARMRRYIEVRLRAIAPEVPDNTKLSLGQLLDLLIREGRIPIEIAQQLRYPIRVANSGIHGLDVDRGQAEEAWVQAASALAELAQLPHRAA